MTHTKSKAKSHGLPLMIHGGLFLVMCRQPTRYLQTT